MTNKQKRLSVLTISARNCTVQGSLTDSSTIKRSGFLYDFKIDTGNKKVFVLSFRCDIENSLFQKIYFYFNDTLRKGHRYFFQNKEHLTTYCLSSISISPNLKIYDVLGSFDLINYSDSSLEIKINEITLKEKFNKKSISTTLYMSDTTLLFNKGKVQR